MFFTRCVRQIDAHLAILELAESATPLTRHTYRLGPLLGKGRGIEHDHAVRFAQVVANLRGKRLEQALIVPGHLPDVLLEALPFMIEQVGDPFARLVLELREESGQILDRVSLLFGLTQRRRERLDEDLEAREETIVTEPVKMELSEPESLRA
jgi:hypothetical protein